MCVCLCVCVSGCLCVTAISQKRLGRLQPNFASHHKMCSSCALRKIVTSSLLMTSQFYEAHNKSTFYDDWRNLVVIGGPVVCILPLPVRCEEQTRQSPVRNREKKRGSQKKIECRFTVSQPIYKLFEPVHFRHAKVVQRRKEKFKNVSCHL